MSKSTVAVGSSRVPFQTIIDAQKAARKYGIPTGLFFSLVYHESTFNQGAVSPAGAIGLTQLMPGTAQGLGVDPYKAKQNLQGGANYLRQMFDRFGSWPLALAAYNAGPNAVAQYGGIPPYAETQNYVKNVLADAQKMTPTSDSLGGLGPILHGITSSPQGKAAQDIYGAGSDLVGGNVSGAAGDIFKAGANLSPIGVTSGLLSKTTSALGLGNIAGDVFKAGLVIVVLLVVLLLSGGLFYTGVRRLSGDRLPSAAGAARNAAVFA